MTNPFARGTAPGRAQPDDQRPGSFKRGHKKQGGRQRGTPNVFSQDYKKAIAEAAYRIGHDGNGKNGVPGYLLWVRERYTTFFYCGFWITLLPLEEAGNRPEGWTEEEINRWYRDYIGSTDKNRMKHKTFQVDCESQWNWTGQELFCRGG